MPPSPEPSRVRAAPGSGAGPSCLARLAVLAALLGTAAHAASPATPPAAEAAPPVAVRVVRNADPTCSHDRCGAWIAVEGTIGHGSADAFARVVRGLKGRALPVLIDSPGGLVGDAMAMGRLIRANRLDVAVTRTLVVSCPADRDACRAPAPAGPTLVGPTPGRAESRSAMCASACVLVLAAGTERLVGPGARVGVHQYVGFVRKMKVMRLFRVATRVVDGVRVEVSRTLVSQKPLPDTAVTVPQRPDYDGSVRYFATMGIGDGLMPLLRSAPATGMHWMSPDELLATGMATSNAGGEELVARDGTVPALARPGGEPYGRETAALIDDAGTRVGLTPGHVAWSVDGGADGSGAGLVATVALDGDAGSLVFRIDAGNGPAGTTATRLTVRMLHGSRSPFRHIIAVATPALRKDAHAAAAPLLGRGEDAPPAAVAMVLSDTAGSLERDVAMLSAAQWVDIPVTVDDNRTLRMTFAIGPSGTFAIRRWARARLDRHGPAAAHPAGPAG